MSNDGIDRARQTLALGKYADWRKQFDVNEYVQHPPLIERLHEERELAISSSADLDKRLGELDTQMRALTLDNQRLKQELDQANRTSNTSFLLTLMASVLSGLGANLATSSTAAWAGWVMVAAACVLQVIAFYSRPRKST